MYFSKSGSSVNTWTLHRVWKAKFGARRPGGACSRLPGWLVRRQDAPNHGRPRVGDVRRPVFPGRPRLFDAACGGGAVHVKRLHCGPGPCASTCPGSVSCLRGRAMQNDCSSRPPAFSSWFLTGPRLYGAVRASCPACRNGQTDMRAWRRCAYPCAVKSRGGLDCSTVSGSVFGRSLLLSHPSILSRMMLVF